MVTYIIVAVVVALGWRGFRYHLDRKRLIEQREAGEHLEKVLSAMD